MTNEKWWDGEEYAKLYAGQEFCLVHDMDKIVAEATRMGEVKALTALAQKISAMTMKDPGGLSENASHEDYFDNGHTVGVNMACMYVIREIDAKLTSLKTP